MRKQIMITNYFPEAVANMREKVGLEASEVAVFIGIDESELLGYEDKNNKVAIDIFLLGSLLKMYEEKYLNETGKKLNISIASDLMYPHTDGLAYQESIVKHPAYEGLFYKRNSNGNIAWITTKSTADGIKRLEFWEEKRHECDIVANDILDSGIRQKVAFCIHPTKIHTCLFSGEEASLEYRYLAPSKITMLNTKYEENFYYYDLDIYELVDMLYIIDECNKFLKVLGVNSVIIEQLDSQTKIKEFLKSEYVEKEKKPYVSPGVMSNSPDRLDGFHSYNSAVRDVMDTGRRKSNLKRYTQDRRAYENWADGDWNKANRLMGEYNKCEIKYACFQCGKTRKMSPDHIGPISLGFAHRAKFQALCSSCNSSKNNKMSFNDVSLLLEHEKTEDIVSWHSKYLWDKLKEKIHTDTDAYNLSVLMRSNMHNILELLSMLNKSGYSSFLETLLNPHYAYYNHTFQNFNPINLTSLTANVIESTSANDKKKANRYIRVSFESLEQYADVTNRKVNSIIDSDDIEEKIANIIEYLETIDSDSNADSVTESFDSAKKELKMAIELIGGKLLSDSSFNI